MVKHYIYDFSHTKQPLNLTVKYTSNDAAERCKVVKLMVRHTKENQCLRETFLKYSNLEVLN